MAQHTDVCCFVLILTALPMASNLAIFARLWSSWQWRPLRNCPGRFCLVHVNPHLQLIGDAPTTFHRVQKARDPVLVAEFVDSGLISYVRADGTLLHTLNTPGGLLWKLHQLGIDPSPAPAERQLASV